MFSIRQPSSLILQPLISMLCKHRLALYLSFVCTTCCLLVAVRTGLAEKPAAAKANLFAREKLVAWCIVPFDAKKRGPEERAEMLARLGFKHFVYDWRAEHLPSFQQEIDSLKRRGVALDGVWFPGLDKDGQFILDVLARNKIKTQLWVTGGGEPTKSPEEQRARVVAEAARIRPIAEAAAKIGCTVGLYNHGGWFGEPENQLEILEELKLPNVGIVYNQHHGHDHLDRFAALLEKMKPHLLALNLNGMIKEGDRKGQKIVPLGQGELDLDLLKTIRASGYAGPIGILGHTMDDAEERLKDNLDGLDWLVARLDGKPAPAKPKPRTYVAPQPGAGPNGWIAEGKPDYRKPPLTVECRAKLNSKGNFNILVASDTKLSGAHWELFSMAGDGRFTVYLPGMQPDHVRSEVDICDRQWHRLAFVYEPDRVRLYCDGNQVADQAIKSQGKGEVPGGLAFTRLVEGGIGCDGTLDWVQLRRGASEPKGANEQAPAIDDATLGFWRFGAAGQPVEDLSKHKNRAAVASTAASAPPSSVLPPPGNHLTPIDPQLKAVLIDRSENDAFMAVKADSMGRLFVGGREAVFVYEPKADGSYEPKRELFHFPQDSIIIGLETRGHDLYIQTSCALYLAPDAVVKRENLSLKRLVWGVPLDLHVSFHCLAWGPEGDLYLDHGDPLLNYGDWSRPDHWGHWTLFSQPEGTKTPYTGVGSVLRVRPDGSRLQVVAGGFRGPVGLAFDDRWNLFSNDNDHESRADQYAPARLMHVTPHADFAWPRGWLASKLPDRADLLDLMTDSLGRGVPCDLAFYDESYFPEIYRRNLLMCRWDQMAAPRYPLHQRGASFTAEELGFVKGANQARPVGITVGRGGRVFVTSLYLGGNVVSPYCASDLVMITRADDSPEHPFEPYDITTISAKQLWNDLSSNSGERRSRAHQEILRRGGALLAEAAGRLAKIDDHDPALFHLPWIAAASGSANAREAILKLASDSRGEVRQMAVRILKEFVALKAPHGVFEKALADSDPRVQLAALDYFFSSEKAPPLAPVATLAASSDSYLRQTASRLLGSRFSTSDLKSLSDSSDEPTRLAAVLAAGARLTVPSAHDTPAETLSLFYPEGNAFFHTTLNFADTDEPAELSKLGRIGSYTIAQRWKTIPATPEQKELVALLAGALNDQAPAMQLQAAYYLSLLNDPQFEPRVAEVRRQVERKKLAGAPNKEVTQMWAIGPFADDAKGFERVHPPEQGVVDLAAEYASGSGKAAWQGIEGAGGRFRLAAGEGKGQLVSRYLYFQLQSIRRQPALLELRASDAVKLWHNGRPVELLTGGAEGAKEWLLDAQPGSNDILLRVQSAPKGDELRLSYRASDALVAVLPEKLDASLLASRLKQGAGAETIGPQFLDADWSRAASEGNAAQGRKLFGTLGCVKCHAIAPDQKGGGAPSLVEVKRRFTVPYLVESVLAPSRQVAEPFRGVVIATAQGESLAGLVVNESQDSFELLLADATRRTIAKADIEERGASTVSPMPAGLVKTPDELRDLLAYLLSDNPTPP